METLNFQGVYPILVTPFDENEQPDLKSFDRLVRFMADVGVDGITIIGVLGESNRMTDHERESLIRTTVFAAEGKIPVIVGTSHPGTEATCQLSKMAESLGAQGIMITPSRETVPNEDRIFEYFAKVAGSTSLPIVVQDHPASTQVHMSVPLLLRLVDEIPTVSCVKEEATPTPPKISALLGGMNRSVPILTGLGALYGSYDLARGSHGFMTGFAFPEVLMAMVDASRNGDWDKVSRIYAHYLPLIVFEQQPGVAVRKEIFKKRGLIDDGTIRHPGRGIDPETAKHLADLLDRTFQGIDITKPIEVTV